MTVKIISQSISMKVWDQARIKLATPGSAVGFATDCSTGPSPPKTYVLIRNHPSTYFINMCGDKKVLWTDK